MNKCKTTYIVIAIFINSLVIGQEAFHNFGNVQIHEEGQVGFHIDLINNGSFTNNLGLAGFYNQNNQLFISGANQPVFFDVEVDTPFDLTLEVPVGITNFLDYVNGRIITPRTDPGIFLDFTNNGLYQGEIDADHTDGYVNNNGDLDFTFPIGDDFRLRTMSVLPADNTFTSYKAAYFFEDPNDPSTLIGSFNTDLFQNSLSIISTKEYWDLDGTLPTRVRLTWDEQSDIELLADDLSFLRVVGFSPVLNRWVNLGNSSFSGTMNQGDITSDIIEPNQFSALTIGSVLRGNGAITVYTAISPNGDGINDTFVIEGLETSPNNELIIFNRWGVEVFRKRNYDNSFDGRSNGRATIREDEQLPVGTYYYVLKLEDQKDLAGAFYINR